jgi:hypothetical protein
MFSTEWPGKQDLNLLPFCFNVIQVLVGCDGGNSVVAKWMGFSQPRPVGQVTIRGISEYRNGHTFDPVVHQIMGQGTRAGIVPVSQTKVYWFVLFKASPSGMYCDNFPFCLLCSIYVTWKLKILDVHIPCEEKENKCLSLGHEDFLNPSQKICDINVCCNFC